MIAAGCAGLSILGAMGCVTTHVTAKSWLEIKTRNFEVVSNLDRAASVELANELEGFRAVAGQRLTVPLPERAFPAHVYVFEAQEDWDAFAPGAKLGGYFIPGWRFQVIAINTAVAPKQSRTIVYHEYLHKLLERSGALYPLWYEEGLAELFSTAALGQGRITLGTPPARLSIVKIARPHSYAERAATGSHIARSVKNPSEDQDMFYARAWARVNYLHLAHLTQPRVVDQRQKLLAFLRLLNAGTGEDVAFAQAFGMDLASFDRKVDAYLQQDDLPLIALAVEAPGATEMQVRALPESVVARRLGDLALRTGTFEQARRIFERALALDPSDARAMSGLARALLASAKDQPSDVARAEQLMARAVEAAGQDPIPRLDVAAYLLDKALATPPGGNADELITQARAQAELAVAADPDLAEAQALLGLSYVVRQSDDPRPGIRALNRATTLLPRDGLIAFFLATLAVRIGRIDDARALLRVVTHTRHGSAAAQEAEALLRQLDQAGQ